MTIILSILVMESLKLENLRLETLTVEQLQKTEGGRLWFRRIPSFAMDRYRLIESLYPKAGWT